MASSCRRRRTASPQPTGRSSPALRRSSGRCCGSGSGSSSSRCRGRRRRQRQRRGATASGGNSGSAWQCLGRGGSRRPQQQRRWRPGGQQQQQQQQPMEEGPPRCSWIHGSSSSSSSSSSWGQQTWPSRRSRTALPRPKAAGGGEMGPHARQEPSGAGCFRQKPSPPPSPLAHRFLAAFHVMLCQTGLPLTTRLHQTFPRGSWRDS